MRDRHHGQHASGSIHAPRHSPAAWDATFKLLEHFTPQLGN
jgi:hypothetical protein